MFSACPKYTLRTPLVMCVKLLKTASLGAQLDYGENRIEGEEYKIGLKPGSHSGVEVHTHTHTRIKNQVGSREPFNTHLRPRLKRQSTSSPGALQHRASPHAPPNFTHGCTPVEVFYSGFWCVSAESHCSKYLFYRLETLPDIELLWSLNFLKLCSTFAIFFLCDSPHSSRQMRYI